MSRIRVWLALLIFTLVLPAAARAQYLFSSGFEGATIVPPWDHYYYVDAVTLNTNLAYVHSGSQSLQIHYYLPGGSEADTNEYVVKELDPGLAHLFARGYVYFKSPEAGGNKNQVQRKLYYLKDADDASWSVTLTVWCKTGDPDNLWLFVGSAYTGRSQIPYWDLAALSWDTWYCLEMEVQANTPALSDGIIRVWLDGIKVMDETGLDLRGNFTTGLGYLQFGDQADTNVAVNEYRYWDDVVIDDAYIGVMGEEPPPPTGHSFGTVVVIGTTMSR